MSQPLSKLLHVQRKFIYGRTAASLHQEFGVFTGVLESSKNFSGVIVDLGFCDIVS